MELSRTGPDSAAHEASALAVYAAAAAILALGLYRARGYYVDDAFITLRYVNRWLGGHGLTWTDGERVEGYSHPIWLLQIALLTKLGVGAVDAPRVLGIGYAFALLTVFHRARARPSAALALATLPGISLWAMGGLETICFTFWLVLSARLLLPLLEGRSVTRGGGVRAGVALAAAALARPEGTALVLVAASWLMLRRRWHNLPPMLTAWAIPVGGWEAFRLVYYGDFVSNAARAKLGSGTLLRDLKDGCSYLAAAAPSWVFAVVAATAAIALAREPTRRRVALAVTTLAAPVVLSVFLGGGDHMQGARLLLPATALLVFAAGIAGPTFAPAAGTVLLCGAAAIQAPRTLGHDRSADLAVVYGVPTGRYFEERLRPGSLIAMATAGSTPFMAPSMRFVDTLGLNDRDVARRTAPMDVATWQAMAGHRAGDGAYVLSRAPDVVVLGGPTGTLGEDARQWFLTDTELLQLPGFRESYRPYGFSLPDDYLVAYLRIGSGAAEDFAKSGRRLRSPWDVLPNQHARSNAAMAQGVDFPRE